MRKRIGLSIERVNFSFRASCLFFPLLLPPNQLPSSYARGGGGRQAGGVVGMVTERETIARPLAPPEVVSLSSEEDSDPEEEEEDEEEEELVAEAVENLLGDIEVCPHLPIMLHISFNSKLFVSCS